MPEEAADFQAESLTLHRLLEPLAEPDFATPTAFKCWTLNDILAHLHFFNALADLSLIDEGRFSAELARFTALQREPGATMCSVTDALLEGLHGPALLRAWLAQVDAMTPRWLTADAKRRLPWVGPSMSVRSSITARLMETWAHAQAIYDLFGIERIAHDRIRSIAVLGVNTFGWTYANRGLAMPERRPFIALTAPSGEIWQWHDPAVDERIEGSAVGYCQVVTQVRNVADTDLVVTGALAREWMSIAQCFAGPPNDPPPPGSRRRADAPPGFIVARGSPP